MALAGISSIIFFAIVGHYNGLHMDDLDFTLQTGRDGILSLPVDKYKLWQGRFLFHFTNAILCMVFIKSGGMLAVTLLSYGIQLAMITRAVSILFKSDWKMSAAIAMVLINIYYIGLYESASYFWLCTMCYHIGHALMIWGFAELYRLDSTGSNTPLSHSFIGAIFFMIGFTYETMAAVLLFTLGCYILYKIITDSMRHTIDRHPLLFHAMGTMLLGFAIMVLAPGNVVRFNVVGRPPLSVVSIMQFLGNDISKLTVANLERWYLFIGLFLLALPIVPQRTKQFSNKQAASLMALSLIINIVLTLLGLLLMIYAVGEIYIERANAYLLIHTMAMFIYWAYIIANTYHIAYSPHIAALTATLLLISNVTTTVLTYPEISSYGKQRIERINHLKSLSGQGVSEAQFLPHYTPPQVHGLPCMTQPLVFTEDVQQDSTYFANKAYRDIYGLNFNVYSDLERLW